eukprot:CAMPEP_0181291130 /NCGR_PEP_ID=MMETSP1101-20121128/1798_1 /TAXON_ID=46948 /ORGANISM="Rhodomonas abbreviata, Strain Caron Lab Isolate" /LENGTH=236 /DNA_ID=CAMNT_0023395491 /DNA_START=386 /DNA_END=1093 /DNA_ORIENTATION=-
MRSKDIVPTAEPWGKNRTCVLLATFPNSGTSWTLRMFEQATKIRPFTYYRKESAEKHPRKAYVLERARARLPHDDEACLAKHHLFGVGYQDAPATEDKDLNAKLRNVVRKHKRAVRLIRNPVDNLISRVRNQLNDGITYDGIFQNEKIPDWWLEAELGRYFGWHEALNEAAEKEDLKVQTIEYELLYTSTKKTMLSILKFMGFNSTYGRKWRAPSPRHGNSEALVRLQLGIPLHLS